mgnify:CR=1 FL=1
MRNHPLILRQVLSIHQIVVVPAQQVQTRLRDQNAHRDAADRVQPRHASMSPLRHTHPMYAPPSPANATTDAQTSERWWYAFATSTLELFFSPMRFVTR